MTRGTTSICRQRRPQQGQKAPRAVTGAPVAAYWPFQRYRSEKYSVSASVLPYTGRQLSATERWDVLGFFIALFLLYNTLSVFSVKVNKKHKNH